MAGLVAALALMAAVLYGPLSRWWSSRRELARTESQLAEERARTTTLLERRDRALTEDYVEEVARGMGYVKPGEIPLVVLDEEASSGSPGGETTGVTGTEDKASP